MKKQIIDKETIKKIEKEYEKYYEDFCNTARICIDRLVKTGEYELCCQIANLARRVDVEREK